jgi:hypothetical protein
MENIEKRINSDLDIIMKEYLVFIGSEFNWFSYKDRIILIKSIYEKLWLDISKLDLDI